MADERIMAMVAEACLGPDDDARLGERIGELLARHGIDGDDAAALAEVGPRLAIYRRLVRNNLTEVTFRLLPRTRHRLNSLADGAFDRAFSRFLHERGPRTHYLRDVPQEFVDWAEAAWREPEARVPGYAGDMARHELSEFAVGAAPADDPAVVVGEIALESPLVFGAAVRFARYAHAVHELPADEDDTTEPEARPTALLGYRDADNLVRFLELTPVAASMVEAWMGGATLAEGIRGACEAHGVALDDGVLADMARLLASLGERGIVLGGG